LTLSEACEVEADCSQSPQVDKFSMWYLASQLIKQKRKAHICAPFLLSLAPLALGVS